MFLADPFRDKLWAQAGQEFGIREGKLIIIKRSLYGLKYSGPEFRAFLAEKLYDIGFKSSIANPDVLMRTSTKPTREKCYEYILCYVDDLLCISHNTNKPMNHIQSTLKNSRLLSWIKFEEEIPRWKGGLENVHHRLYKISCGEC